MPQVYDARELLGVRVGASAEEIKKAFRQRAKDVHPDLSQAPDATEQFKRLNAAHELLLRRLSNPQAPVPPILHRETKPVSESKRSSRRSNVHHNTPEQAERKRQEREAKRARAERESLARKRAEREREERERQAREEAERQRQEAERERKREAAERERIRAEQERAPPRRANGWRAERSEPPSSSTAASRSKDESMAITNRDRLGRALDLLKGCLAPYVEREFTNMYGERADEQARSYFDDRRWPLDRPIREWDAAVLLKLISRPPAWNDVFSRTLGRVERSYVSELRDARNRWAHQEPFSNEDTERVLDTSTRLLTAISAAEAADEITKMRSELLRTMLDQQTQNEQERVAREEVERRHQEEVRQQREAQRLQGAKEARERQERELRERKQTQRQPSARRTPARVSTPQRQAKPPPAQRICAWKDCSEFRNLSEPFTTELGPRRFCTTHRADYIKRNAKKSVRRN